MLAHEEIDDALLFSQRRHVERMVSDWCAGFNADSKLPFNVIAALDSLGLLDREKVREFYKEPREVQENDQPPSCKHWKGLT